MTRVKVAVEDSVALDYTIYRLLALSIVPIDMPDTSTQVHLLMHNIYSEEK